MNNEDDQWKRISPNIFNYKNVVLQYFFTKQKFNTEYFPVLDILILIMMQQRQAQAHTFISGSLRLAWSQSTETTGSLVDMDCVEKEAFESTNNEAQETETEVL